MLGMERFPRWCSPLPFAPLPRALSVQPRLWAFHPPPCFVCYFCFAPQYPHGSLHRGNGNFHMQVICNLARPVPLTAIGRLGMGVFQSCNGSSRGCLLMLERPGMFTGIEDYYSTTFHELTHWTGHETRLNRPGITDLAGFGSHTYSQEELVAEMGAAFLCAEARISEGVIENQTAYIQGWLKKLKNDKKLVVVAAAQAQKAADYVLNRGVATDEEVDA